MAEADPQIVEDTETNAKGKHGRPWRRIGLMLSVPLLLVAGGSYYWLSQQGKVTTDNAYIKQDMVAVSSEVGGKIVEVFVTEDSHVEAGDLLFRINPEPYEMQIAEAEAAIDADLTGVEIAAAREDVAFAQSRLERQQALWERGFTTKADYDAARHAVAQAQEEVRQAQALQTEARARLANGAAVPGRNPQVATAEAKKASAELDLRRTQVRTAISGRVAQADRLQIGQQAVPNLPVLTVIADDTTYIEANFKETELNAMRPGQRAEIHVDAYPGLVLRGHVGAIGAGTGSEFSVLPAQNATGNWVKVTQRVPVRIIIDEPSPRDLIAGLSTKVTVFTDNEDE